MKYVLGQGRLREILVARGGVGLCGMLVMIGVAGCPGVVLPPGFGGAVGDTPAVVGCSEILWRGTIFSSTGCMQGVLSFDTEITQITAQDVSHGAFHITCAGACIDSATLWEPVDECPNDPDKSHPGDCGCGVPDTDSDANGVTDCLDDGNRDPSVTSPLGKTSGEPDDSFLTPVVAVFDAAGNAALKGTVASSEDLDVFLLDAFSPGDRIIVDAYANGSPLDITIALFDDQGRLVFNNDDRQVQTSCGQEIQPPTSLDAYADLIVRHAGNPYYLVVTHSPFAASNALIGSYRVDIKAESGFDVPQPAAQTLLLDFDGAVVNSPMLGQMTLAVFNAADISPVYEGTTQTVKNRIRDVFDQNYERFNVIILTTDDPPPPPGAVYSTIFFGGFDRRAFGLAENVDLYDIDRCDDAIIFTESFTPSVFIGVPTATELGTAIGNVGSHEAGHLLGLNHTDDDLDLMDDQSPADAFLEDQEFMEAPLSTDIMPIGTQDGVLLLDEIVGPR
jgi:hypothetical protein